MDESQKYYAQRKKPDRKEYLLYGSVFMNFKNREDSAAVDILVADSRGGTCILLSPPWIDWRGTERKFSVMRMLYIIIGVVVIVLKIHETVHIKICVSYVIYLPYINCFNIQQKANEKDKCRSRQMSKAESNYSFQI